MLVAALTLALEGHAAPCRKTESQESEESYRTVEYRTFDLPTGFAGKSSLSPIAHNAFLASMSRRTFRPQQRCELLMAMVAVAMMIAWRGWDKMTKDEKRVEDGVKIGLGWRDKQTSSNAH